jgi:hypothetical protein
MGALAAAAKGRFTEVLTAIGFGCFVRVAIGALNPEKAERWRIIAKEKERVTD